MPRKPRITGVPVERQVLTSKVSDQEEEGLVRAWPDEPQEEAKTDAEHMTEVINEVRVADEDAPAPVVEPVTPKAKPNKQSKSS